MSRERHGLAKHKCLRAPDSKSEMVDLDAGRWVVMEFVQSAGSEGLAARRRVAGWRASEYKRDPETVEHERGYRPGRRGAVHVEYGVRDNYAS